MQIFKLYTCHAEECDFTEVQLRGPTSTVPTYRETHGRTLHGHEVELLECLDVDLLHEITTALRATLVSTPSRYLHAVNGLDLVELRVRRDEDRLHGGGQGDVPSYGILVPAGKRAVEHGHFAA